MLPTIDISLIGVLLSIWAGIKAIWGFAVTMFDWVQQRALGLIIGSKLWATAAFLTVGVLLITAVSSLIAIALNYVSTLVISSLGIPLEVQNFLSLYVDFSELSSLASYIIGCSVTYFVVCGTQAGLRQCIHIYTVLSRGWKN